jgi:hypothetical protein
MIAGASATGAFVKASVDGQGQRVYLLNVRLDGRADDRSLNGARN